MNDLPKQPAISDPANELASDSSPIDPRDFRNALGTYATGVTIITAVGPDGRPCGLTCNSFAGVEWVPGLGDAPILADSVANFQCRAANRYYGGDHVIFLGAVEAYSYNRREPLLFARGSYGRFLAADDATRLPKP